MPSTEISGSQLGMTWGSFFMSVPITSALWGIGCLQLYLYCELGQRYWETDQRWFRLYISLIWLLDTGHQALVVHFNYFYFVKGILDRELFTTLPKTLIIVTALTGPINAMIQAILVRRVWYLSNRNRVLTGFLSAAVIAQFTVTMACYVRTFGITKFTELYENVPLELAFTCITMFADTLLAAVLVWLLWRARSGLRTSDSLVSRLVAYIIGSSLLTVLCMSISFVASIAAPHSFIYMTADIIVPKLYFNCMLASLNARSSLRKNLVVSASGITFKLTSPPRSHGSPRTSSDVSPEDCDIANNVDLEARQVTPKDCGNISSVAGTRRSGDAVVSLRSVKF